MDKAWLNEWNVGMKLCTGHFPLHGAWPTFYPAMNYTPSTMYWTDKVYTACSNTMPCEYQLTQNKNYEETAAEISAQSSPEIFVFPHFETLIRKRSVANKTAFIFVRLV
jgi:hypothetical protein